MNFPFVPPFIFQDCKEFQGELFGISNLFRDLSDKLFTSEIIETHEKQVTTTNPDCTELVSGSMDGRVKNPKKAATSKLTLEDLGKFIIKTPYDLQIESFLPSLSHV